MEKGRRRGRWRERHAGSSKQPGGVFKVGIHFPGITQVDRTWLRIPFRTFAVKFTDGLWKIIITCRKAVRKNSADAVRPTSRFSRCPMADREMYPLQGVAHSYLMPGRTGKTPIFILSLGSFWR